MIDMKKKQKIVFARRTLILLSLIALLLIAGLLALGQSRRSEEPEPTAVFAPDLDPNAQKWTQQALQSDSGEEQLGIKIPNYRAITLPANTTDVSVALVNPEGNPCYFTFSLMLKDTGETLYTSGMVSPGDAITNITLSRPLEAGEYDATIQITTAALTDGRVLNGADVETVLVVQ